MVNELGLIVMKNFKEFGEQVNNHLKKINGNQKDYIVPIEQPRFANGEAKARIEQAIRDKHLFILSDIGNYSCTYKMNNIINHMSPDDHFQDIKRVISAISGDTKEKTVVTPLLYGSRQHKRRGRESLDCAMGLQELDNLKINGIVTFDAHDPNVQNAVPNLSFENCYPTNTILKKFFNDEDIDLNNLQVVNPDAGAADRARLFADILETEIGNFNKRRDLSSIVDGRNPISSHEYNGDDVNNKNIIIVDDMIASGDSILDVANELKNRGANDIYVFCTYAFFSKGIENVECAFERGAIHKIYTTNLSYIPENISNKEWLVKVDCTEFVAKIINTLYCHQSLSPLLDGKDEMRDVARVYRQTHRK